MRISGPKPRHLILAVMIGLAACWNSRAASTQPKVPPPNSGSFAFIAVGCMPYARLPDSTNAYRRVLSEIDRHSPAFAVHLGDLFGSEEPATDALLERRRTEFDSMKTPVVYTPGDNEWTDVHRAGLFQPAERLDRIRQTFFPEERSRGRTPIPLITQRQDPRFQRYAENARWSHGSVLFATVHIVGSGNNHQTNVAGAIEEWADRNRANTAWIRETFGEARRTGAPGVALFCQANPIPGHPGFAPFLETLAAEVRAYGRPVLLVHADEHRYRLEPGFRPVPGTPPVPNLTRLETFGASDFHGVLVTVDPRSAAVFLPGPLVVPGNPLPNLPRPAATPATPVAGP
jgi:hypothetical protein